MYGKTVTVDTDKTDRYGRKVGKVLVDGVDTNLEQVRRGLAWHYKAYQREQPPEDRLAYAAAEKDAAAARPSCAPGTHRVAAPAPSRRGPPLWDGADAQVGDGVDVAPDSVL